MAFTHDPGRQYVLAAIASFTYADFESGTYLGLVEMPADAVVVGGHIAVDTVFDSGTSDTFTVGDNTDDDEYASSVDGQAAGATALVPTGFQFSATGSVGVKWTGAGSAPTQGAGHLVVLYVREGRSNEVQG